MSRRPRRNHSPDFKAKVAFAAIKGDQTLAQLSAQFDVHANQILDWKNQLLSQSARVFESATSKPEPDVDLKSYCQIWCSANLSGVLFDLHSIFKLDACDDFVQVFKAAPR